MSATGATPETFTLTRREGVSDGRWKMIQRGAHLIATGHMPWCQDHQGEDGPEGWCRVRVWTFAGEVEINNSTNEGSVVIGLHNAVDPNEMTVPEAAALGSALVQASQIARHGRSATDLGD